jgi:O-antigen/teichoic acid export membrane protein
VATSAIVTSVAVAAALFFWPGAAMSEDALWATIVLTCGIPLLAAGDVLGSAHRGVNRLGTKLLLIDVGRPGIVALAVILSPLAFVRRAPYIAGLYVLAALLVLAGLWLLFERDRRWRDTGAATSSELLRFGVPVAGAAILAGPLVNGLLPTMLSASAGSAAVALYGVALALQGVVALPVGIFEQVLVPVWARMATDGSHDDLARSYQHYTRICFALAAGLGIVLIANAGPMLSFVFGGAYAAAAPALEWAVAATLFAAWTGPNEAMLRALGLARPIFVARLVTAAAGTIAAGALIPQYGLLGAIAAFALAVVVLNVSYASTLYRERRIHPFTPWQTATTLGVVGAILAATAAGRHSQGGWIVAHVAALVVVVANIDLRSTLAVVRETARTFR